MPSEDNGPVGNHEVSLFTRLRQSTAAKLTALVLALAAGVAATAAYVTRDRVPEGQTLTDERELDIIPGSDIDTEFVKGAIAWDVSNAPGNHRLPNGGIEESVAVVYQGDGRYKAKAIVIRPDDPALRQSSHTYSRLDISSVVRNDDGVGYQEATSSESSRPVREHHFADDSGFSYTYTARFYETNSIRPGEGDEVFAYLSDPDDAMMLPDQTVIAKENGSPKIRGFPTLEN